MVRACGSLGITLINLYKDTRSPFLTFENFFIRKYGRGGEGLKRRYSAIGQSCSVLVHLIECRSVDIQDGVSAQCDLVAEFQHVAVVGATQLIPVV